MYREIVAKLCKINHKWFFCLNIKFYFIRWLNENVLRNNYFELFFYLYFVNIEYTKYDYTFANFNRWKKVFNQNINQNAHLITIQFFCFDFTDKSSYFNFLLIVQPQLNLFILSELHMPNRVYMKLYKRNQLQINITIK